MIYQKPESQNPLSPPRTGLSAVWVIFLWPASIVVAFWFGTMVPGGPPQRSRAVPQRQALPIPPPPTRVQAPVQVESTAGRLFETTPNDLVFYYRENPVSAADWLNGKTIRITARVAGVSNNLFGGGHAAVVFETTLDRYLSPDVVYWYSEDFRSRIGGIKAGQYVTVEGRFEDAGFMGDMKFRGEKLWTEGN